MTEHKCPTCGQGFESPSIASLLSYLRGHETKQMEFVERINEHLKASDKGPSERAQKSLRRRKATVHKWKTWADHVEKLAISQAHSLEKK